MKPLSLPRLDETRAGGAKPFPTARKTGCFRCAACFVAMVMSCLAALSAAGDPLDNWVEIQVDTNINLTCIAYGSPGFVAAGSWGTNGVILHSRNGMEWARVASPEALDAVAACYGKGAYVILYGDGSIQHSVDATNWARVRAPDDCRLTAITASEELFLAAATRYDVPVLLSSVDGQDWNRELALSIPEPEYKSVSALTYYRNAFLAATDGAGCWRSEDGITWAPVEFPFNPIKAFAGGPELLVGVGGFPGGMCSPSRGEIVTSIDGLKWDLRVSVMGSLYSGAAYGNGYFVALSPWEAAYTFDGTGCWIPRPRARWSWLNGIAFGENVFVAVGSEGVILRSGVVSANVPRAQFASCETSAVYEGAGTVSLLVRRFGDTNAYLTVHYRTMDGSAVAGRDYEATDGTLAFAPGQTRHRINVRILEDFLPESPETFTVLLDSPAGGEVGKPDLATVQIEDADSEYLNHWLTIIPQASASEIRAMASDGSTIVALGSQLWTSDGSSDVVALRSVDGFSWQSAPVVRRGIPRELCWGADRFVAAFMSQESWTWQTSISFDGKTWSGPGALCNLIPSSLSSGNGRFVIAGQNYGGNGIAESSADGLTWICASNLPTAAPLTSVAWGNGAFFAVGMESLGSSRTNVLVTSKDGIQWSIVASDLPDYASRIAFGNGCFVAAGTGRDGSDAFTAIASSTDGLTWDQHIVCTRSTLDSLTFANGVFLATVTSISSNPHTLLLTSTDGIGWVLGYPTPWNSPAAMFFQNGVYLTAGWGIWSSTNTVEWHEQVPAQVPGGNSFSDMVYANGRLVAVGSMILSSADGWAWKVQVPKEDPPLQSVAYGNARFVAAGGTRLMASADGEHWEERAVVTNANLNHVAYGNARFLALGEEWNGEAYTNHVFYSADGLKWAQFHTLPGISGNVRGFAFGKGLFVAAVDDTAGSNWIYTSPDGRSWAAHSLQPYDHLNSLRFLNGLFVAVGGDYGSGPKCDSAISCVIFTSTDGLDWAAQPLPQRTLGWTYGIRPTGRPLMDVTYAGGLFVAVGSLLGDFVVTSPDATNWVERALNSGIGLARVTAINNQLIALGGDGRILRPGAFLLPPSPASAQHPGPTLTLVAEPGRQHIVQASSNLIDWTNLLTLAPTNGVTRFVDSQTGASLRRYFRTLESHPAGAR